MDAIHRIDNLDIKVKREEMSRLLGYGRSGLPERVEALLSEIEKQADELIEPRCAYRFLKRHDLAHSPYLYHVDNTALCLVTIGAKLEAAVNEYKEKGELGRTLVLDTYGSAAAEATAEAANEIIERELSKKGLYCSQRFSPGYACWDVKEQSWILPVLESEALGVTLTEGCMMVPRKSVSFAVTIADSPMDSRHEHTCDSCGMIDCLYKLPD
jgi:cobalamin-dependent methionine synthase I